MKPLSELGKKRVRQPKKPLRKFNADVSKGKHGLQWTSLVGQITAHPAAFAIVVFYAGAWLLFDRQHFDFNAVATLAVWIMTLLIQRANRRDTLALHAKLDELLRVDTDARSELTRLDEKEPEEIEIHRNAEVKKANATK